MMKTICICNRCKNEFPAKKAKRIIFESSLPEKENAGSKIVDMIMTLFPLPVSRDYCPECVSEIKEFMKKKEGVNDENCIDKHKGEMVETDSFGEKDGGDQEDGAGGN